MGAFIMNYANEAMKAHKEWKGKIEIVSRVEVDSREKLSDRKSVV